MKTKELIKEIGKLEEVVSAFESAAAIRKWCEKRGLNWRKAGDYAAAAISVLEYERPPSLNEKPSDHTERLGELRNCNFGNNCSLDAAHRGGYNEDEDIITIASLHGWLDKVKNEAKHLVSDRGGISGGKIRNDTGYTIQVAGSRTKNGPKETIYLRPGHSSDEVFDDADAVVIIPGQRFERPFMGGLVIVTQGAIKFKDYSKNAYVTWSNGVFKVHAAFAEYFGPADAKDQKWGPKGEWPDEVIARD